MVALILLLLSAPEATLTGISFDSSSLTVTADAALAPRIHWLPMTNREALVIDLSGTRLGNAAPKGLKPESVMHVGISQWKASPPVTRIVLHFPSRVPYELTRADTTFILSFGGDTTKTAAQPALTETHATPPPTRPQDRRISLLFRDADLSNVLRVIGEQNHLNVVLPPGLEGLVTVYLENVPIRDALAKILAVHNYGFVIDNNILLVVPAANHPGNYTLYRPDPDRAGMLFELLRSILPPPAQLHFDETTRTIILYAPAPGSKRVFESIYEGLTEAKEQ